MDQQVHWLRELPAKRVLEWPAINTILSWDWGSNPNSWCLVLGDPGIHTNPGDATFLVDVLMIHHAVDVAHRPGPLDWCVPQEPWRACSFGETLREPRLQDRPLKGIRLLVSMLGEAARAWQAD